MADLSVIIINYKTKDLTLKCIKSILEKKWKNKIDLFIVDNASNDGSVETIKKHYPKIGLIESKVNLGFAGGNNLALEQSKSPFCLLLNSDTEVCEGSLDRLLAVAKQNNLDVCSCKLVYPDGSFQPNAGELPTPLPILIWLSGLDDFLTKFIKVPSYQAKDVKYYSEDRMVGWVSGSVMLIRTEILKKTGLLDSNIFMYGEDVEFCLRAQKLKLRVGWTNKAKIIHLGGGSWKSPKYNQWLGEFRGLLYIYNKYYGFIALIYLKTMIYIFTIARMFAFSLLGKFDYAGAYAKIFTKI